MNLKSKLENVKNYFIEKPKKAALYTVLGLATIVGTGSGNVGGLTPFNNVKEGTNYGINASVAADNNGTFNGASIAIASEQDNVNGIEVSLVSELKENLNGVDIGLWNIMGNDSELNGLQLGIVNTATDLYEKGGRYRIKTGTNSQVNGLQIGLVNYTNDLNGVQIGLVNYDGKNWSLLANWDFNTDE